MPTLNMPRGQQSRLRLRAESTFGTLPSGNFFETPYYSETLQGAQSLQPDPVIGTGRANDRDQMGPAPSLKTASGQIDVPMCLNNFGAWLAAFFGAPTTTEDTGTYSHVFASGALDLPTFAIANLMGSGLHKRSLGMALDTIEIDLNKADGFRRARLGFQGSDVTTVSSVTTGSPASPLAYKPFPAQLIALKIDTVAADYVMGGSLRLANNMAVDQYLDGRDTASAIYPGTTEATGRIQARVVDSSLITWAQSVATVKRLTLEFATGTPDELLIIDMPRVRLERASPPVNGPAGITFDVNFRAEQGVSAGQHMVTATLVNALAGTTYTTGLGIT